MKNILLLFFALFLILSKLNAKESDGMQDFEALLDDVSDIATKKSLNVDYLPSVVTVIEAQTYIDGGIQNIGEALGMLPGFQIQLSPIGYTMTTVRGLKNPNAYLSDKIKVFIDGVAINNEVSGSSNFYMDFPMQLVEKIEVLRGPNSTVYGAGALYATVNIITKLGNSKKENQLFLGGGSYDYITSGANVYETTGDWKLFADGYYQQNNKALDVPNTTGQTDEALQDLSLGFKAIKGNFEFLTRYKQNRSGNFYGFEGELNPIPSKDEEHKNLYFFAQAKYKTYFKDYKLDTKANFSHREINVNANIASIEEIKSKFARVEIDMQEGFFFKKELQEENFEIESVLTLPKININNISIGVGARYAKIQKDNYYNSVENAITQNRSAILGHVNYSSFRFREQKEPAFWANPTTQFLKNNLSRTIVYGYLEDLVSLHRDVDIILGLRADNYSDFGTKVSKRVALVYRPTDKTILKFLYGSAFRAPTFTEAYANGHINLRAGDENINPEETNTYEAVVIYSPDFNNKFSLNVYYSELDDVIDLEEDEFTIAGYQNYETRISKGLEFEYYFHAKLKHNFYFNASYIDAKYTIPPESGEVSKTQSMPDISKVMLKAMYIYTPTTKFSLGTTWHYYTETTRTELNWVDETYRPTARAVHIFDETITYRFSSASEIRATIKNLLDADVRQPSYYYTADNGIKREGRNWFLSYVYKF